MQLLQVFRLQPVASSEIIFGQSYSSSSAKFSPLLWRSVGIGFVMLCVLNFGAAQAHSTGFRIPAIPVSAAANTPPVQPIAAPPVQLPVHHVVTPANIVPACQPGSYTLPTMISTTGQTGVSIQTDTPGTYSVYGLSVAAISRQMAACTPVSEDGSRFAANTGYALSSYYTYGVAGDSSCKVISATVTAHINQVFPAWQRTAGASDALAIRWNTFITNLRTHEQGHVDLDKQYAQQLYDDLLNLPAQDCSTIKQAADTVVARDYAAVNKANNDYDAQTKHGTTQGAVL